jgi:xylose isomerase
LVTIPLAVLYGFILGMDTFALGLIKAARLIEEGELDAFVEKRYESFASDLGERIRSGNATLEELADRAAQMGSCPTPASGRQEYLESIVNRVMFG